jgi:hypothetical protein
VTIFAFIFLKKTNDCAINHSERGEEKGGNLACCMLRFFIEIEELLAWGLYRGKVNICQEAS